MRFTKQSLRATKRSEAISFLFMITFITCLATSSFAESTGASFLKIGVGAKPIGMGSAYAAVSNDVTAINWNPAGLTQLTKSEFSAMHSQWIVDTNLDFAGIAVPMKRGDVLGTSVIYLSQGDLEGRNDSGQRTGSFGASDLAVTMSYSRKLNSGLSSGINVKFIKQQIENESAIGLAMDIGLLTRLPIRSLPLSAGIAVQNIGPQMRFIKEGYNLPMAVSAGLGYNLGAMIVALDIKQQVYEGRTSISVGTEYWPVSSIALRAGYATKLIDALKTNNITSSETGNFSVPTGFGAGLGIKFFSNYQMDYSFVPYGILGDTHRISFSASF